MKIPKTFKIGKTKYNVETVEALAGCRGEINYDEKVIRLAMRSQQYAYKADEKSNTFWHELTHAILHDMGNDLAYNEKFVSAFSDRLDQAIKTAKL